MSEKIKLIGDYLGTIEEFVPCEGTYSDDGKIYASNIGKAVLDQENHIARIEAKMPSEMKVGQVIFGDVMGMRKNTVTVIARKIQGIKGDIDVKTGLYVSNIAKNYVEKPEDFFGIGDIIKAKVLKIEHGLIDITTKEDDFGVVKAFCKRCRYPLEKADDQNRLTCPSCGHRENRKLSKDFGNVETI
ncbi:MAG: exosome complex RNA-binding protein Csl4 [Candidatus Altiarchaeota archaeon]|nr:exosome complex RNA-binding protein Csl4 [Candidatus Altiarchaeota archaeon]